jgi:hypothetical protein
VQAPRNRRLANPYRLWILRGERLLWACNENSSEYDCDGERNQFVFQQSNTSYFGFCYFMRRSCDSGLASNRVSKLSLSALLEGASGYL